MQFQLEADTDWIRRAAATLDEAARDLSPSGYGGAAAVGVDSFGDSTEAMATVGLVNLRAEQASEATAAIRAISSGLAARLRAAADALDATEDGVRQGPR